MPNHEVGSPVVYKLTPVVIGEPSSLCDAVLISDSLNGDVQRKSGQSRTSHVAVQRDSTISLSKNRSSKGCSKSIRMKNERREVLPLIVPFFLTTENPIHSALRCSSPLTGFQFGSNYTLTRCDSQDIFDTGLLVDNMWMLRIDGANNEMTGVVGVTSSTTKTVCFTSADTTGNGESENRNLRDVQPAETANAMNALFCWPNSDVQSLLVLCVTPHSEHGQERQPLLLEHMGGGMIEEIEASRRIDNEKNSNSTILLRVTPKGFSILDALDRAETKSPYRRDLCLSSSWIISASAFDEELMAITTTTRGNNNSRST